MKQTIQILTILILALSLPVHAKPTPAPTATPSPAPTAPAVTASREVHLVTWEDLIAAGIVAASPTPNPKK